MFNNLNSSKIHSNYLLNNETCRILALIVLIALLIFPFEQSYGDSWFYKGIPYVTDDVPTSIIPTLPSSSNMTSSFPTDGSSPTTTTTTTTITTTTTSTTTTTTSTTTTSSTTTTCYTTLIDDDFESGWGKWDDEGTCSEIYSEKPEYVFSGDYAVHISDTCSIVMDDGIDVHTPDYTTIIISLWFIPICMDDSNDSLYVCYYDGSSWNIVCVFAYTIDFENNGEIYHMIFSVLESSYTFPVDMKVRIKAGCCSNDDFYIDEVEISGICGGSKAASPSEEIAIQEPVIPENFSLGCYPNPFNPRTTICYSLPVEGNVQLSIYDITGRRVAELFNGYQTAGEYRHVWEAVAANGQRLTSGVYFLHINAGEYQQTVKMLYAR